MPMISESALARVQSALVGASTKANRYAEKAKEKQAEMVKLAEMAGGAAAAGFVRGKMEDADGSWNVPGTTLDVELVAGLAISGGALFDLFGEYDHDALNVGGGILAHFAGQVFRKYGKSGNFALVSGTPILGATIVGHQPGGDVEPALAALR